MTTLASVHLWSSGSEADRGSGRRQEETHSLVFVSCRPMVRGVVVVVVVGGGVRMIVYGPSVSLAPVSQKRGLGPHLDIQDVLLMESRIFRMSQQRREITQVQQKPLYFHHIVYFCVNFSSVGCVFISGSL